MTLTTYVNFSGRCAEAFRFYEQHLGGKIGDDDDARAISRPEPDPADWRHAVLHARMDLGGTTLLGADIPNAQPMRSAYLSLDVESDGEAERIFSALADGGRTFMPMQETFFATRFGQLQDQFGINWMILHARPMPQQQ